MNTVKGSIVKALAGKEKGSFFLAVAVDSTYVYIADGRRRKVEHPKKKKLIHVSATNTIVKGSFETNPQIKRILNEFIKNGG